MRVSLFVERTTGHSGVELFTLDLALGLAELGTDVEVRAHFRGGEVGRELERSWIPLLPFASTRTPDLCVAPKGETLEFALATGAPTIQAIHSEHPNDVPRARVAAAFGVRRSIVARAIAARTGVPVALIRNPLGYDRIRNGRRSSTTRVPWISFAEWDELKARMFAAAARHFGPGGLVVGRAIDAGRLPDAVASRKATLEVGSLYACAELAVSYRLSRIVPEALACGIPVACFGGLEPDRRTGDDPEDDWTILRPGDLDLAPFDRKAVAARLLAFAIDVVSRRASSEGEWSPT